MKIKNYDIPGLKKLLEDIQSRQNLNDETMPEVDSYIFNTDEAEVVRLDGVDIPIYTAAEFIQRSEKYKLVFSKSNQVYLILVGPTCGGKSYISNAILEKTGGLVNKVVGFTERGIRPGEVNGEDYFFLSPSKINKLLEARPWNYFRNVDNFFKWMSSGVLSKVENYSKHLPVCRYGFFSPSVFNCKTYTKDAFKEFVGNIMEEPLEIKDKWFEVQDSPVILYNTDLILAEKLVKMLVEKENVPRESILVTFVAAPLDVRKKRFESRPDYVGSQSWDMRNDQDKALYTEERLANIVDLIIDAE